MELTLSIAVKMLAVLSLAVSLLAPLTTVSHTATAAELFTLNHRMIVDGTQIIVAGEIINNQSVPVRNVTVRISFIDENQSLVKDFSTQTWLEVIPPNRRAPFRHIADEQDVEGFAAYTVEITHYEISSYDRPRGLLINQAQLILLPEAAIISGLIMNDNTENIRLSDIIVIACFYDDKGFLATESCILNLAEPISPTMTAEFQIATEYVNQSSNLKQYILTAEAVVPPPHHGYSINSEKVLLIVPKEPDQSIDYRLIIPLLFVIAMIAAAIYAVRKEKQKKKRTQKSKRP